MSVRAEIEAILSTLHHPELKEIDLGLSRVEAFLERLGSPHHRLPPVIHVAGTNGKGSLIAYLNAILTAAGKRVHRYISPHLVRFNERITLAGAEISDEALLALLTRVQGASRAEPVTYFEATTAAAFLAFAETPADVLLLETGMGGRLDATNVVEKPLLTAITPISLDHCEYLGNTVAEVAQEKAGIIKRGVPCVVGPQPPEALAVLRRVAAEKGAPLFIYSQGWWVEHAMYRSAQRSLALLPALAGEHQVRNAATAVACLEQIPGWGVTNTHIGYGIRHAHWPARLQHLQHGKLSSALPEGWQLWLDGGHNPDAGKALSEWTHAHAPIIAICGMVAAKDAPGFLSPLAASVKHLYAVAIPDEPRSAPPETIVEAAKHERIPVSVAPGVEMAISQALRDFPGVKTILICGSLYLAGRVLALEA